MCPSDADNSKDTKKSLVHPSLRRLSPGAFSQETIKLERTLWSKYSGEEEKESYTIKGSLQIEVVTSEGNFVRDFPIEVTFDDLPF